MTQYEASKDLAIKHYGGKWRQAQRLVKAEDCKRDNWEESYWSRVRSTYFALGGILIAELSPRKQALYFKGEYIA